MSDFDLQGISMTSFREDRNENVDLPHLDDVVTAADKIAYQQILRRIWEECEVPSRLPFAPMDAEWWQYPYGVDPAALLQQQLRRLKRTMSNE